MNPRGPMAQWALVSAAGVAAFVIANRLAGPEEPQEAAPALVREAAAQTVASTAQRADERLARPPTAPAREAIDLAASETFVSTSWAPPPAPVVQAPPPPPPSAPPLPFRFVGALEGKGDEPLAFIAKGEALHMIRAGDIVEGVYRIESLSPTQIVITYLPMDQKQVLAVSGGQP